MRLGAGGHNREPGRIAWLCPGKYTEDKVIHGEDITNGVVDVLRSGRISSNLHRRTDRVPTEMTKMIKNNQEMPALTKQ